MTAYSVNMHVLYFYTNIAVSVHFGPSSSLSYRRGCLPKWTADFRRTTTTLGDNAPRRDPNQTREGRIDMKVGKSRGRNKDYSKWGIQGYEGAPGQAGSFWR